MQVLHSVLAKIYDILVGTNLVGTQGVSLKGFFVSRRPAILWALTNTAIHVSHILCTKLKLLTAAFLAVIFVETSRTISLPTKGNVWPKLGLAWLLEHPHAAAEHPLLLPGAWHLTQHTAVLPGWRGSGWLLQTTAYLRGFGINFSTWHIKPVVTWNWSIAQTVLKPFPPSVCVKSS